MSEARRFYAQIRGAVFEDDLHLPPPQPSAVVQRDIVCTLHSECPSKHVPWVSALCNWAIKEKCVVGKDAVSRFGYPCPRNLVPPALPAKSLFPLHTSLRKRRGNNEFCMVSAGEGVLVQRENRMSFQSKEITTKWINTFRRHSGGKWCHAASGFAENDVNPIHEREEEVAIR